MGFLFNPFTGNFDAVDSKWRVDDVGARRHISPKTETDVLYIGERDGGSAIESTFPEATAIFAGSNTDGINYFINLAPGVGFTGFGGLFVSMRSRGTHATPVNVQSGDWLGALGFGGYVGNWVVGSTYALPGYYASVLDTDEATDFGTRLYMGSALYEGITIDMPTTGTPQLATYINRPNHDVDFYVNWASGTAMFVEGSSGQIRVADGSASAPQLSFISDTNTGIYSAGADQVGVATDGVAQVIVDGSDSNTPLIEMLPTDRTLTAYKAALALNNTYTLNFTNSISPPGFDYSSTVIYAQNGYGFGSGSGFFMHPLIQNSSGSTRTLGPWVGFSSTPTYQANGGSLSGQAIDIVTNSTFNRINSGTTSFSNHYGVWAQGGTVDTGATVTNRYGFYFTETGTINGTLTSTAGITSHTILGTNRTHVLLGTGTIPTGTWGIYQSSAEDNLFNGDIQIADGSAGSPSLTFSADTDTGIHRVGANQMSFDTNGLARVQISATSTVVNPANLATGDFQVHGDTVNNLIFTDASADALGFFNATPVAQSTGWSVTNETTDKSFDANATSIDELADVLGTLIETLKTYGILGA